jgi:hypothetical protein
MKKIASLLAIVLALALYAAPAHAGRIYFNAAGAESPETATSGVPCAAIVNQSSLQWDSTYVTRDCDKDSDEGFWWHFYWQPDMPTTGNVTVSIEFAAASSNGVVRADVMLACSASGSGIAMTPGAITSSNISASSILYGQANFTVALPTGAATPAGDYYCGVSFKRDADNGNDTLAADVKIRGGFIQY